MMQQDERKPTMSEIYAEFDSSDNLEGNDEDIGALGSILSWDDEDDEAVGISVAATSSALEQCDGDPGLPTSVSYSKDSYLPDLGGNNTNPNNAAAAVQMPVAGALGFNAQTTGQQTQTVQPQNVTMIQPQRTQQVLAPAPGGQPQVMFYQMPTAFQPGTTTDGQQAVTLPSGFTLTALPRPGAVQQQEQQQPRAQQTFNIGDPNAYLRQMQAAQVQQHFNALQQSRPLAPQPAPAIRTLPQTQQVLSSATTSQSPATVATPQIQKEVMNQAPKPPRPQPTIPGAQTAIQQPASGVARLNVVSCSDTDGDSKAGGTAAEKKTEKKKATAGTQKGGKQTAADQAAEPDTSNMTPTEKAKANRDRNREHARNTRLRKKAYLEKLKMTVDELCRERDTLVSERAGAANLLVEMHNTRTEVLMSFFALRSAYEKRRELWASILDESCFACVMPVTPYRSFPASEVQVSKCQRTILGIDGMMADTASLHVLLNSMIDRSRYPNASIAFRYTLVTEDAVVAGNQMMARWVMSTLNATQCGARMEVSKQGMLCCKFNSANRIIGLELMFDVMAFMLQLKQAAGTESFSVVPNTVQTCQRSFDSPMVMTLAERPYTIVQVNKLWEDMTGFKAEDVVGKASCQVLQGQDTDRNALEGLMYAVRFKRPASCVLLNYTRSGKRFRSYLNVYPLSTDSKVTHYVALTAHVDRLDGSGAPATSGVQNLQPVLSAPQGTLLQQQQLQAPAATQQPTIDQGHQQPQAVPKPLVMPATATPNQGVTIGVSNGLGASTVAPKPIQAPPTTLPNTSGVQFYMPQQILSSPPVTMAPTTLGQMVAPTPSVADASAASTANTAASNAKRPLENSTQENAHKQARRT